MRAITVYCSSSSHLEPVYHRAAEAFGRAIASRGIELVYGGGSQGLMGTIARAVHELDGQVTGVITERLHGPERAYHAADELIVVPTMRERKRILMERGDGFAVLPGGVGTLEELFEALTARLVGEHDKPIGILDVQRFFEPLMDLLSHGVQHRFVKAPVLELLVLDDDPDRLVEKLLAHEHEELDEERFLPMGRG